MRKTAADSMPNLTGSIIADHYELQNMLGSGTYGVVYKALDRRTATDSQPTYRAIKVLADGRTMDVEDPKAIRGNIVRGESMILHAVR